MNKEISRSEFSSGTRLNWLWHPWLFFMRWVAPIAIVFIILQQSKLIDIDAYFTHKPAVKEQENTQEPAFSFPGLNLKQQKS